MPWNKKVTVFGAGGTGSAIAELLVRKQVKEIALIDVLGNIAEGRALDIEQTGVLSGSDTQIVAGSDYRLVKQSDIVIVTAGIGRRPGLAREELLRTNGAILTKIGESIRLYAPDAFVIVLTNPADILTRVLFETTQFPPHRVMGQGGILDSARLSHWIARLLRVQQTRVQSVVLGGHGDHMVPVKRLCSVHGVPASDLLTDDQWQTAVHHARYGGGEILAKFKHHGAAVTPAYAVMEMVEALLSPTPQILPVSVRSEGHFGLPKDVFIGLPVKISQAGIVEILEVPLDDQEINALQLSASTMEKAYLDWKSSPQEDACQS